MELPARVLVLCIALVLVLVPVSESAKVQEPTEFVEEDGKKIPVFKANNPEDYDDSDVVVLTKDNFTQAINNNKNILVEFYAPWCGHCKQLKPEYGEAAERLKKSHPEVVLAKFDAVAEGAEAIAKEYDIKGFPTMKWFVDGTPHPKDCQVREAQEIIRWVAKRSGPPLKPVVHKGDMDIIKSKDTRYAVVGFFDDIDSDAFKTFATLASHDDRFDFYSVLDKAIAKEEGVSKMPAVIFYRNFDEPKLTYDKPITADDLADAVRANSRPRLIPMTEETAPIIFENELPKLFLFRPGTALADFTQASEDMELRGHYIFSTVGEKGDPGLSEFLGVSKEKTEPELFLFDHIAHKKYRLESDVSVPAIKALVKGVKDKTHKEFLKAAPVEVDWDQSAVKSISSSQWEAVVLDQTKHVVVEIYAPWCGHCKTLEPKYLKAAEHLDAKFSDELVFAKMDGTANEVANVNIAGFPTVLAFSKLDKTPADLSQKMHGATAKDIVKLVKETFNLSDKKREGEAEYEAAAKRFKAAIKGLKGPLTPAATELNKAAAVLEKLTVAAVKKTEL